MGFDFIERNVALKEFFERSSFAIGNAAGNDQIEVAEIGGDVKGQAVGSDPAADVDADGGEFFLGDIVGGLDPDAGLAGDAIGGDAEFSGGADHGFFERADVPVDVAADAIEIENGIADDLARAVIGDVSATVGFAEFDAFLAKDVFGGEKIFLAGVAAEGEDVRVLAEKKDVVDGASFTRSDQAFLEGVGVGPGEETEVDGEERWHERRG